MQIQYFDTLAPGLKINILMSGYLFHAAEARNHHLYAFKSTGEDETNPIICSSLQSDQHTKGSLPLPTFNPRRLENLEFRDKIENYGPINDMKIEDLTGEMSP
jgi:hypothetical protein